MIDKILDMDNSEERATEDSGADVHRVPDNRAGLDRTTEDRLAEYSSAEYKSMRNWFNTIFLSMKAELGSLIT